MKKYVRYKYQQAEPQDACYPRGQLAAAEQPKQHLYQALRQCQGGLLVSATGRKYRASTEDIRFQRHLQVQNTAQLLKHMPCHQPMARKRRTTFPAAAGQHTPC